MKALRVRGAWRRLAPLTRSSVFASVCAHRMCASVPAQEILPPAPIVHSTIADAHIHASELLAELLHRRPPTSLDVYVHLLEEWWRAVGQLVLLPFASEDIGDLPQYLVECAGVRVHHERHGEGSISAGEEESTLLEGWDAWVWSSTPRTMPTAVTFSEAVGDEAPGRSDAHRREVMSFPELTGLLSSYSRYHRGVGWGAHRPDSSDVATRGGAAAAAYYRRRYLLHPWHCLSCPEGTGQQMPYVHVLRWMLAGEQGETSPEELWRQHRAVENFRAPRSTPAMFRALDMCSQSGYVTDLLLRAGADLVVAVDADVHALGNTESTYHEHLREGRSKRRDQVLLTRRCDALPMPKRRDIGAEALTQQQAELTRREDEVKDAQATSATAAQQRRRRAQQEGRGYSGIRGDASSTDGDASSPTALHNAADGAPFHVVYVHPPAPSVVWPVVAAHGSPTSLHRTAWWRSLVQRAAEAGVPSHLLLPFVPCDAFAAAKRRSPMTTLSGLRRVVESLRADVTERRSTPASNAKSGQQSPSSSSATEAQASSGGDALLSEEGYVVLVLPRTYDVNLLLQSQPQHLGPSLADWVVAQLDGYYDLILRRRCLVHAASSVSARGQLDAVEESLVTYPRRLAMHADTENGAAAPRNGTDKDAAAVAGRAGPSQWRGQLSDLYQKEWWQDVLVLKKNLTMTRRCAEAATRRGTQSLIEQRLSALRRSDTAVAWEDSFEYNEYHPRDGAALTSHHWTDLMPTYSYLEPDFFDSASAQRNFLAVGHQPASVHARAASAGYGVPALQESATGQQSPTGGAVNGVAAASAQAALNFHTLFAQELRTRRRSKLRKLALSPLERQEWYIDEKLIKSSGARVELMNELSKWDLKDYDN